MTINKILFEKLHEKGLKQKDLADFLHINQSVTTNWKNRGNNPPSEFIVPICEFLDISIYELLGISKNENEIEHIYNKLSPEDKAIVDNIFNRYRKDTLSSVTKIG